MSGIYLILATDKENSLDLRNSTRVDHIKHLQKGKIKIKVAGPLIENGNMCGSMLLVEAFSKEEVQKWLAEDPYNKVGLFERVEIKEMSIGIWDNG